MKFIKRCLRYFLAIAVFIVLSVSLSEIFKYFGFPGAGPWIVLLIIALSFGCTDKVWRWLDK